MICRAASLQVQMQCEYVLIYCNLTKLLQISVLVSCLYIILALRTLKHHQTLFFCSVQCHPVVIFAWRAAQPAGKAGLHAEPCGQHHDGDTCSRG